MNCCKNELGSFPHNEPIDLNIVAEKSGKYVYRLLYLGSVIYKEQGDVEAGDDLILPIPFNENYTYELTIIDPELEPVELNDCSTFIFNTFTAIKSNCNGNECIDADESAPSDYDYS